MYSIPVIAYHHISPDREITPEIFKSQLKYFKEKGYHFISGKELVELLEGKIKINKPIMLTFDDGYVDNWIYAFPIIKEYLAKAVIFLTCDYIRDSNEVRPSYDQNPTIDTIKDERGPLSFLTWEEIRIMNRSSFIEFGSHTLTHKNFKKKSEYTDINKEIIESKKIIEEKLETACYQIAWPWGYFKEEWLDIVKNNGYKLAYMYKPGPNTSKKTSTFMISRIKAKPNLTNSFKFFFYENYCFMYIYGQLYGLDVRIKKNIIDFVNKLFK